MKQLKGVNFIDQGFSNDQVDFLKYDEKNVGNFGEPTVQTYSELAKGYAFFNERLFQNQLPPVIFTLTRRKTCLGYFAGSEFKHIRSKNSMDEIAMNSMYMALLTDEKIWSTVVHEQVHVWQYHFSNYSDRRKKRRAYHDKEWGRKMEELGLIPSATGKPGGKKTGNRVSHYIVQNGCFQKACHELIASGLTFTWREQENEQLKNRLKTNRRFKKDLTKTPFKCPKCNQRAWANHTAAIACVRTSCGGVRMLKQN